jgi:putative peptidoglycan lipid II flippase
MAPVVIGAGVAQVNVLVDSIFCSFLPPGSISFIYFADRFIQLPLALLGISMATILLPEIATSITKKNSSTGLQDKVAIFTLRLAIPSVIGLIILAHSLIGALYGHGEFSALAVNSTTTVLQIFAIGLPAYIMSKIFSSVLFAEKDSKTPVIAAVVSIASNIVLNCVLISYLGVIGVAISTSVSGFANAYVMYRKSKKWFVLNKTTVVALLKILLASCVMGMCMQWMPRGSSDAITSEITHIACNTFLGIVIYTTSLLLLQDEVVTKMCKRALRAINFS